MKKRYFIALGLTIGILYFTHHTWLGYKKSPDFDYLLFIIISTLGYMVCFKITSYIADFKTIKHQSRIEILFLTTFFIMLFVPMSHINQHDGIAINENRKLAKWKPLITKNSKINYNFGRDFENWFNDRFALRGETIKIFNKFKMNLVHNVYVTNGVFWNKSNNWMHSVTARQYNINDQEAKDIVSGVTALQNYCKKHNIKLYILISPTKYSIYKNNLYPLNIKSNEIKATSQIISYVKNKTGQNILYPYNVIKKTSLNNKNKDLLYFKSDHHWTDEGAYIAYIELMKQIQKDFPDIYVCKKSDFAYFYSNKVRVEPDKAPHRGRTYEKISRDDNDVEALDYKYKYYKHKNYKQLSINVERLKWNYFKVKHFIYNRKAQNVVIMGDSMGENLLQFLPFSFYKTERLYNWSPELFNNSENIKRIKRYISKTKPKIMIIVFIDIARLKNFKSFDFVEDK